MTDENLHTLLNNYWLEFQENRLTKGDIVAIFLVLYDFVVPVDNWLQCSPKRRNTLQPLTSLFYPKRSDDFQNHPFFKKYGPEYSMGEIINQSQFKKETLRSTRGLIHVYLQPDTIKILDYIPSPLQVLEMQADGFRCVSLLRSENWYRYAFDHRRNIRDFVIHDLEHIWQMFENPAMTKSQIEFSDRLLKLIQSGRFDFLLSDTRFNGEFNYIISDMNTHPAHTYVTLKSLLLRQKAKSNEEISDIMQHFNSLLNSSEPADWDGLSIMTIE